MVMKKMAVAFSSDAVSVMEQKLTQSEHGLQTTKNIEDRFSLTLCANWIKENDLKKVALQIPDELQNNAAFIALWLEKNTTSECFILADTSYGSCCVDEIAAEHCSAEGIIHFGHSCLSPTRRLPALLVFDKAKIDVIDCCDKFKATVPDVSSSVILLYHVSYYHKINEVHESLKQIYSNLSLSLLNIAENCSIASENQSTFKRIKAAPDDSSQVDTLNESTACCGRTIKVAESELKHHVVFYFGPETLTLSNFLVLWSQSTFYSYNPETAICRKEGVHINRVLGKRYFLVEKAKDAQIVGIVVGTLGVANYLQVIDRMKLLLKKAGKKSYTFVMGKLNTAKLANFMEIDIFVLVACPENSLLDSAEFYRPVITPYEMELACHPDRQWTGGVITDYQTLLPGGQSHVALPEGDIEEHQDISLVTGRIRSMGVRAGGDPSDGANRTVAKRSNNTEVAMVTAGDVLAQRSWTGLEPKLGQTPVCKAVEGRKGIAIAYEEEPKQT